MTRIRVAAALALTITMSMAATGPVSADDNEASPLTQYLLTATEARAATKSVRLTRETATCWDQTLTIGGPASLCVASYSWIDRVPTKPNPSEISFVLFETPANSHEHFTKSTLPKALGGSGLFGTPTVIKKTKDMFIFVYNKPPVREGMPLHGRTAKVFDGVIFEASCVHHGVTVSRTATKVTAKQRKALTDCLAASLAAQLGKFTSS